MLASVYDVRVVTNAVHSRGRRIGSPLKALTAGCEQLGLHCRILPAIGAVVIEEQNFQVRLCERINETVARGLSETIANNEILVAQRITEEAKVILRERGVAFFDERGYLSIRSPGIVVESIVNLPTSSPPVRRRGHPLDGIGLDVALWLLHTNEPTGVRGIGREIGRTASSVSDALRRLVQEGLITAKHEPLLPELFDSAVQAWRYRSNPTTVLGDPTTHGNSKALLTNLDDSAGKGWAWSGSAAESAWGVPGISRQGGRKTFVVPDFEAFDVALTILKPDPNGSIDLVVAPVAWLASHRAVRNDKVVVPAIVIAISLALDDARGRELLSGWNPEGVNRVW